MKTQLKSTDDLPCTIVTLDIEMMNIYCSSWLSSRFSTAIDDTKHTHQRSWPSSEGHIYSSHAEESGTFYSLLKSLLHAFTNLALERLHVQNFPHSPERKKSTTCEILSDPGIMFQDITTLLLDHKAFKDTVDIFVDRYRDMHISVVAGIEARGFVFGSSVALGIGAKFVPLRKPRKLPGCDGPFETMCGKALSYFGCSIT
ncbi:adenine phosphoribosyltransferase 2-like protein [Trifolium pratense]|uniref:adenine phosphoribosyltransferase n=1 Tax=Trifolium pratense TaxID=57577 RepID=A0A2K3N620_TRIPR|nr:adenine phosphoribosyltransferase 2-like protein [Trifolium pratense]